MYYSVKLAYVIVFGRMCTYFLKYTCNTIYSHYIYYTQLIQYIHTSQIKRVNVCSIRILSCQYFTCTIDTVEKWREGD